MCCSGPSCMTQDLPQVYQVCNQLSPWFMLHDPGPSVTCSKCTRSIINYHLGPSCMTKGLLNHAPSVSGLLSTITLVHICMIQGHWSHAPSVPGPSTITWSKLYGPGPFVTCSRYT